jgi:5'-3' exonuclease
LESALPREEVFVKTVSSAVLTAMNEKPDATEYVVFYDLDDTTVKRDIFDKARHIVRPAAVPLIAALHGLDPRIKSGLLTSRSHSYLEKELADPNELAALVPYLDPSKVLSSREVDTYEFASKYVDENDALSRGVKEKIVVCEEVLQTSPNISVILVEDLYGFDKVKSDNRFRVVALDGTNQFFFL